MITTLEDLALDLDGRLVRPGDADWDLARRAWNLAIDQRPAAVVVAKSVRDVQTTVRAAAELGMRVAPQATGHNAGPLGSLDDAILLRLGELNSISVDPTARIARADAGVLWQDVTAEVTKHGLAALAGSAADVGVVGYTLGGGLSWLGRSHGFAAQSVTAFEVVTADGQARRVDAGHDPELFWALRGGGGSFAIVTAVEFRLYPLTEVQAGMMMFPIERASEVLHTWQRCTRAFPTQITSVGRILRFPPDPAMPAALSGKSFAVIDGVSTLPAGQTDAYLAPLRALGPIMDTFGPTPVDQLAQLHMDPPGPVPGAGDGFQLADLPAEAVDALISVAGPRTDCPLLVVDIRHIQGANRAGQGGSPAVIDNLTGDYAVFAIGITPDASSMAQVTSAVEGVRAALAPWQADTCYLNFTEQARTGRQLFGQRTLQALRRVKALYDPAGLIKANHEVAPED
jgi:UDP-N-acetylenolpyruvoylglucosamine reductase